MIGILITLLILVTLYSFYFVVNRVKEPFNDWERDDFKYRFEKQCDQYKAPEWLVQLYFTACYDDSWNPKLDFDGCTTIQDLKQPCGPCFVHDWMWKTGQGGKVSDKLFYHILIATGCAKWKAKLMYCLVRIGWAIKYKRFHLKNRNVNNYHLCVLDACDAIGIKIR